MTIMTIAGGNLFRVAAEIFGDATQWTRIARSNRLLDPLLEGVVELNIPDDGSQPSQQYDSQW